MRNWFTTYKTLISNIALALVVFGAVVFISYRQNRRANLSAEYVSKTLGILFHKERLNSAVTASETDSRSFILTHDPAFLAGYRESTRRIRDQLTQLAVLTTDNAVQSARVDSLEVYISRRIALTDSVLAGGRDLNAASINPLITGRGKFYIQRTRALLDSLHTEENRLYTEGIKDKEELADNQNRGLLALILFIVIALAFFSWRETRRMATEERRQLKRLSESEQRFRGLVENNEGLIALLDADLNIVYRSPASERITGWTLQELSVMGTGKMVHPDDAARVNEALSRALSQPGVKVALQMRTRHKEGHWVWVEGVLTNRFDDPAVNGIVLNMHDVTERKEAEEQIIRLNQDLEHKVALRTAQLQNANEDMEAFTYSVSHDLRAPLRIIHGFTTILEEEYTSRLDDEARRLMGIIRRNTQKMGALIDGLLTFSRMRLQEIKVTMVDTGQMVADVIRTLDTGDGHAPIRWQVGSLPEMHGDPNALRQVWINLISNAIKYSSQSSEPAITIDSYTKEDQQVFFVKDNGVGFDPQYAGKLFKVFQRLHGANEFEGTGIGLAVVHKIVTKHGGNVWAEGRPGGGAVFYFSLPLSSN